jgi:hypothetical protein
MAKNPFNQRNPRLIKDLSAYNALYICRDTFTNVMSALQIKLFMQNKANFQKVKLNVNKVLTKDYEQMDTWSIRKTKPIQSQLKPIKANSKPIKANTMPKQSQFKPNQTQNEPKLKKAKMNVNRVLTKDYENKPPIRASKKQSQTSKRQKPMQPSLPQRIMKKTAFSGTGKTKPNKPNFRANIMLLRMTINPRRKSLGHYADWRLFDRQMLNRINEFWATNFISKA